MTQITKGGEYSEPVSKRYYQAIESSWWGRGFRAVIVSSKYGQFEIRGGAFYSQYRGTIYRPFFTVEGKIRPDHISFRVAI